jgi:ribosomal protein S18 acetylase RimI-like enzyme
VADVGFRHATAGDAEGIARLHYQSWRENYRGAYSDAFLDGEALADRLTVWRTRLTGSDPSRFTIVAESDGAIVGFAFTILDEDSVLGAVLQNLHVTTSLQRQGIGSRLMAEVARTVLDRRPASGLHVWVRTQNAPAKAFYKARRGTPAGRRLGGPFADGSRAPVVCFAWSSPVTVLGSPGRVGRGGEMGTEAAPTTRGMKQSQSATGGKQRVTVSYWR